MPNTQPNSQKAILELMATYNQSANKAMIEVLEELDESELEKDRGLFYKSILGTMVHFTAADATFFKDYFAGFCKVDSSGENSCASTPNANKIEAMLESPFSLKPEIANDATNLFAAREEIDSYILQVVANIEDFSAVRELAFPWGAMSALAGVIYREMRSNKNVDYQKIERADQVRLAAEEVIEYRK